MGTARALLWMVCKFGLRRTIRYERNRRAGAMLDYAQVLTVDERAVLSEHFEMPWEQGQ